MGILTGYGAHTAVSVAGTGSLSNLYCLILLSCASQSFPLTFELSMQVLESSISVVHRSNFQSWPTHNLNSGTW